MSRLTRLYPQGWRDRYEDEFLALLEERPPTTRDVLDTLRGAIDAHLHPQQAGGVEPTPWTHRVPGLLAVAAGAIWCAFVLMVGFQLEWEPWPDGLLGWSILLMFLSLPGDYMAAHGRQIAIAFGVIGAGIVIAPLVGWDWPLAIISIVLVFTVFGGMLTMAAIRAELGTGTRWVLIALVVALPVALLIPTAMGFASDRWQAVATLLPYGITWILVGLRLVVRGSATFVDQPGDAVGSEVRPA